VDPRDIVRSGYDVVSLTYRPDDAPDSYYGEWLSEFAPHVPAGASILDLGCGCGVPVTRWLVEGGFDVTGIDLSPVQIERARHLIPRATFLCADIAEIELPAASQDAIVSFFAIIHLPVAQQQALFAAIHSWLRPGGWFMATLGTRPWTGTEDNWLGAGATIYWSHAGTETYLEWLGEAGFHVEWHRFIPEGDGGHTLVLAQA
jgi:SAM-dependent methyltransferase